MKTLDEVIKALEICGHDESPKCPYFDTEHWCCCEDHMRSIYPSKNDALHYLKEYREKLNILEVRMAEYKRGFEQLGVEWSRIKDNPPLTWDELKQMEDDTGTKFYRGLAIVLDFKVFNGNYLHYVCDNYSETCVYVEDIGKTWNAYRKERA